MITSNFYKLFYTLLFLYFVNFFFYIYYIIFNEFNKFSIFFFVKKYYFIYFYYFFKVLFYLFFFFIFYLIFILKLLDKYYTLYYIQKYTLFFLFLLKFNYNVIIDIIKYYLKDNKDNKLFVYQYIKYILYYVSYYIIIFFNNLYIYYYDNYYIWWYTAVVRYYRKIVIYKGVYNEAYTIKYNVNLLKQKILLKKREIIALIKSKIQAKTKFLKMYFVYCYYKFKRLLNIFLNKILFFISDCILFIKYCYYTYFINFLFYYVMKNKGYLFISYIFLTLKYLKSIIIYLWHRYLRWKK